MQDKITESAIEKFTIELLEKQELVTNCDRSDRMKHFSALPRVFTEQGVAMLSSVLKINQRRFTPFNSLQRPFNKGDWFYSKRKAQ